MKWVRHIRFFQLCLGLCASTLMACSYMQMPTPFSVPRVDERPEPHPAHLVRVGDVVTVVTSKVGNHLEDISWSQDNEPMQEGYYVISAVFKNPRIKDALPVQVPIYVHMNLKNIFLEMCKDDETTDTCNLTINRNFRYGQDTEKTRRFLVMHNPNFFPFQHRFMDSNTLAILLKNSHHTASALVGPMADFIPYGNIVLKASNGTAQAIKVTFGDQLWLFNDSSS